MDIDLRLPSGENGKEENEEEDEIDEEVEEEEEQNGTINMFEGDHNGDVVINNMVVVEEKLHNGEQEDDDVDNSTDMIGGSSFSKEEDTNLEPLAGMEFESHGAAYSFYQEYARSIGFNTAIQNSRRSKTSREFIDAKFACSRYGTKRENENKSNNNNSNNNNNCNNNNNNNRPQRSRQGNKQDPENASGRRSCAKTDCKASMHVKRRPDGKWIIHRFEKEHNHELLPAQAVSEQTRKMYAAMARQFAEYKNVVGLKNDSKNPFDKGRNLPLEPGEANILVDFFMKMQSLNSNFFYALDVGEDQRMRNLFWVDAKSRHDYLSFGDVVCFDTSYIRNKYKMPLAVFVGVNQHYQFMLLGCALLSDESAATFLWVMRAWLKAMSGYSPKVMITEQYKSMKLVISSVFPSSQHYFCLWHVMAKFSLDTLLSLRQQKDGVFVNKLHKCIYRSRTEGDFERRWGKLVERFELKDEWIQTLYEDRKQWVPTYYYMKKDDEISLAGMSTGQRSDSVNSFFDKYVHKKTSVQEFVKQYESIIQDRYEEEAKADYDTYNKAPSLKSPSPFEKQLSNLYTNTVFKKFQAEVLGAVACIPRREKNEGTTVIFKVQDFEKDHQGFTVSWDEMKSQVSCVCRLFELRGFLCRHALIVLQICGLSTIPCRYILKRWMKDAKSSDRWHSESSENQVMQSRVQRYNELCQRAVRLGEEGSLSQESYNFALRALEDAFGNCVDLNNNSNKNNNILEAGTSGTPPGLLCLEEDNNNNQRSMNKTALIKKKNPTKKRKVNSEPDVMAVGTQESIQQMDKINSRQVALDGFFGQQPSMQGVVPLNLMASPRDNYYGNPQTVQGIGHLSTIAPNHESFYGNQQTMHGLAQMEFFRSQVFPYGIREDPNLRGAQLHEDASRHT